MSDQVGNQNVGFLMYLLFRGAARTAVSFKAIMVIGHTGKEPTTVRITRSIRT